MTKTDLLRKMIREEVVSAIRQELPRILKEQKSSVFVDPKKALHEQVKAKIPGTLNTIESRKPIKFAGNNPLAAFLNDTAKNMLSEDFDMTTDQVHPTLAFQPKHDKVGDVNSMLSTARPSSNIDAVQINEVPDFSALMGKLKEKGQI